MSEIVKREWQDLRQYAAQYGKRAPGQSQSALRIAIL